MIKEAIDRILQIAKPEVVDYRGLGYSKGDLKLVEGPEPEQLTLHTLDGFVTYCKTQEKEKEIFGTLTVHILDHQTIELVSARDEEYFKRAHILRASTELYDADFKFGNYYSAEDFIIKMQAQFVQTDVTQKILALIGNMKAGKITTAHDDGVTQKVETAMGVTLVKQAEVPNPVQLAPYRTFREIPQPASNFVLRVRSKSPESLPECALFEADGSQWKLAAIKSIQEYLAKAELNLVVLA